MSKVKEFYSKFQGEKWRRGLDVRDFIQNNYKAYEGDESFLAEVTDRTKKVWEHILELMEEELKRGGVLDLDTETPSTITSHPAGYIDEDTEVIVGLQTDEPLKRAIKPNGGIRLVNKAAEAYGYEISDEVNEIFTKYRKTHNDGVFQSYTNDMRLLRSKHILTGLPDNYGRGRIIGDYRRVALYGVDAIIKSKEDSLVDYSDEVDEKIIKEREEINEQIESLKELKEMAEMYGFDISKPATDVKEAIQWTYFGYLGAVKRQDGAAMSLGRMDAFFDIYAERDLEEDNYTESEIQEMIDDFVIKLRIVKHLRHPEYNALFAGDPTWITLVLGGTGINGRSIVNKTSYRFLHTLTNLGPSPEPNLTVLWGDKQPDNWKKYCAKQSVDTSSIQYENDDLMKKYYGDDYGIACCVSGMELGKEMQFFGARCNLAKALLLAINGGKEEPVDCIYKMDPDKEVEFMSNGLEGDRKKKCPRSGDECVDCFVHGGDVIMPGMKKMDENEYLEYDEVWDRFMVVVDWLAERYVKAMNVIHFMHDKYHYESLQMALHDNDVKRNMAFGVAGLSVVVDSLSAIKYAKVKPCWTDRGVADGYEIEGEFPKFGNDDDRVDQIAEDVVREFIDRLEKYRVYRDAKHTLSILTITANVVYGRATGATPDGRDSGEPFAPGANPMHGRDENGAVASLNSVAKIPYEYCLDGISNTFSIVPSALGKDEDSQVNNLVDMMDGYFVGHGAHHLNVNVLDRETLLDAQEHPENYPQLTIRVSGYAVKFNALNKEQQDEVIARTFHKRQ